MKCGLKEFETVYNLLTSKERVGTITDDNSPGMYDITKFLLTSPSVIVLMPSNGTMFVFTSINSITYEAHLTTTQSDKKNVYTHTHKAAKWMQANTKAEVIISNIPEIYSSTLVYSKNIGMERMGVIPKGYIKNGDRINIIIVGAPLAEIIRRTSWHQQ